MSPQPGLFAAPHGSAHKARTIYSAGEIVDFGGFSVPGSVAPTEIPIPLPATAGPGSRIYNIADYPRKEKRKRDISSKVGREMNERREDSRHFHDSMSQVHNASSVQLAIQPESNSMYNLRLLPLSVERSAILAQLDVEEQLMLYCAQTAYEEERDRVEEEWKRGRDRASERLLESIEDRRRKAREEKEGEGPMGDASLDAGSRPPLTRQLRHRLGTSPPSTPVPPNLNSTSVTGLPITTGLFLNPHSLNMDEIPSPFPLPLASVSMSTGASTGGGSSTTTGGGRRRNKGGAGGPSHVVGVLGKSIAMLGVNKDPEADNDMIEIRRGNKRRRNAVQALGPR